MVCCCVLHLRGFAVSLANLHPDNASGLHIVYDQPRPIESPIIKLNSYPAPARPSTSHSALSGWVNSSRISMSVTRTLSAKPRLRPSIGAPTQFRKVVEPPLPTPR